VYVYAARVCVGVGKGGAAEKSSFGIVFVLVEANTKDFQWRQAAA
jgi:hypothetical protein